MLATSVLSERPHVAIRCNACRYFTLDRCCNATARLEGCTDDDGECPHFRFMLAGTAGTPWQVR